MAAYIEPIEPQQEGQPPAFRFLGGTYKAEGERIGDRWVHCHYPRIEGEIIGYSEPRREWLARLDVPYGAEKQIGSIVMESALSHMNVEPGGKYSYGGKYEDGE